MNVGVLSLVEAGGFPVIVVFGAAVSTTNAREAGEGSGFRAGSIAAPRTCDAPALSAAVVNGDVQAAKAAASTRHWNVAPASDVKLKVGVVSFVGPAGPAVIVASGGVRSTS